MCACFTLRLVWEYIYPLGPHIRESSSQKILEFEQEQEEEKRQKQMEQLQEKQKIQEKLADLSLKFQEQKVKLVHGVTSQFLEFCSCSETSVAVQT